MPPWFVVGAAAVLFPIFGYMTLENIHRQKQHGTRLLLEKGAALIRSFEAGTRSGMTGRRREDFELQRLLKETAQQPDILYLYVADSDGKIMAHSDTSHIGKRLRDNMDLKAISHQKKVAYRIVQQKEAGEVFEVFRRFSPTGGPPGLDGRTVFNQLFRDSFRPDENFRTPDLIIFVGLDMTSVEEARKSDMLHTIVMGVTLLFVGFAGILMLFLAQSYRAAKASLSQIKAFSDTLVENMPIGLLAIDNDKNIASLNPVAEKVLEISFDRVAGRPAKDVLPASLWKELEGLGDARGFSDKEIECAVESESETIPLEISAAPLREDGGAVSGCVLLFKDLAELKSLQKQIERSQRLASIGRLAAGVAHEIKNPLSSIKGFATYFKERYREIPQDFETAGILIQEVDRLDRVVNQLLELARPTVIEKRPVCAEELIEDSLLRIRKKAEENRISIETGFLHDRSVLLADRDKICQVLLNVYLNAIDSMAENNREKTLSISLNRPAGGKRLEIHVADCGTGIGDENLAHIFDPFFTTKAGGTGLGLAIVHNIMEAHGGEIQVDTKQGKGTTVILRFPLEEE